MRFLHAADLHIDSPLRGLDRYEGAPVERLRGATRAALEKLVDLAIREAVDFVLLAGDIYAFWGWLWGAIGVLLTVPLMTVLQVILCRIEPLQPVYQLTGRTD